MGRIFPFLMLFEYNVSVSLIALFKSYKCKSFTYFPTTYTNNDRTDGSIHAKGIVTHYRKTFNFAPEIKSILAVVGSFFNQLWNVFAYVHTNTQKR